MNGEDLEPVGAHVETHAGLSKEELARALAAAERRADDLARILKIRSAEDEARLLTQFSVDYAEDLILWISSDADIAYANETSCRTLGYSRERLLNMKLFDIDRTVTSESWPRAWKRVQQRQSYTFETTLITDDGRTIPTEVSNYYLDYRDKQLCCSICRNITERKIAEAALRDAKEDADRANSAKSRFLAAASHDMRQPLQSLNLLHYALTEQVLNKESREIVSDLGQALNIMGNMLDCLLDVSQLETGAIEPSIKSVEIEQIFERLRLVFSPRAAKQSVELKIVSTSAVTHTDPDLLSQMLENVVSNAIDHSKGNKIVLGCRRRDDHLRIEVWDNGVGIPQKQIKSIFEEYYQLDNPARDRNRGLGLGLSIVERMGRLLGHGVDVESVMGQHTMFGVNVPMATPSVQTRTASVGSPRQPMDFKGLSAALIEDDAIVRNASKRLLERWGFEVVAGVNMGDVHTALESRCLEPSIIIADYRLGGGIDGVKAIQDLLAALGKRIPSIIVTGDTSPTMRQRLSAGDSPVLFKPIDPQELRKTISRLVEAQR